MNPINFNTADDPAYLFVEPPGCAPFAIPLEENNSLFVGSGSNCRVVLIGERVEPIHCMFWMNEERVVRVQDWNTVLGTLVNGEAINAETDLKSGDELQIDGTRLVLVLSRQVHQHVTSKLQNAEMIQQMQMANDPTEPLFEEELPVAESRSERCDETPVAESALPPAPVEPEAEECESDQQDVSEFKYDVLADLDDVDEFADEFASDYGRTGFGGTGSDGMNESQNEEMELLRMEVDQLRFELAERDAQVTSRESIENVAPEDDDQTTQLVDRLEDLLGELQTSDDRVRGLEDLLRVSDQATQAERDERLQLENWVTEIENRVSQRESESEAEMSRMTERLAEITHRHKQTQVQLKKVLRSKGAVEGNDANELLLKSREQIEELEQRLESSKQENEQLRESSASANGGASSEEMRQLEQKLVDQQVEFARERAEMSRQRAELERLRGELQENMGSAKNTGNGDARLLAMRQHLREIHEEEMLEREEKRQNSLGGRISRLLGSVGR